MLTTITELRSFVRSQRQLGRKIGLVPTMGALHDGHLSLVKESKRQCGATVVTIFVNPAQFGPNEDFQRYPRTLENDLRLLQAEDVEVFVPSVTEMYPAGFATAVNVGGVAQLLEGVARPTHFQGVATVVLKLFLASETDMAFFGQKDYQQVCVIRRMVADLNVPIDVVMCPIIRESDGLALSSRNRYLSEAERCQSLVLSQSLRLAETMITCGDVRDVAVVKRAVTDHIRTAPDAVIDYVSIADVQTLQELPHIETEAVILLAVKIGSTRLIDNVLIV